MLAETMQVVRKAEAAEALLAIRTSNAIHTRKDDVQKENVAHGVKQNTDAFFAMAVESNISIYTVPAPSIPVHVPAPSNRSSVAPSIKNYIIPHIAQDAQSMV